MEDRKQTLKNNDWLARSAGERGRAGATANRKQNGGLVGSASPPQTQGGRTPVPGRGLGLHRTGTSWQAAGGGARLPEHTTLGLGVTSPWWGQVCVQHSERKGPRAALTAGAGGAPASRGRGFRCGHRAGAEADTWGSSRQQCGSGHRARSARRLVRRAVSPEDPAGRA